MKRLILLCLLVIGTALIGITGCGSKEPYTLTPEDHKTLTKALTEDTPATFQQFLDKGMNPNAQDEKGVSYIVTAIQKGQSDIVRALLNGRADPNLKTPQGDSLLHIAVAQNRADIVAVLLRWDAEVNVTNSDNDTPLHIAARTGNADIAHALVEQKADLKARNNSGKTPVTVAKDNRHDAVVALLKTASGTQ